MHLLQEFRGHLATLRLGGSRALVAVSGGPDSVALLDLLVRSRDVHQLDLVVAHVDHGIYLDSGRVADEVRTLAERYGLPFECGRLGLGADAGETVARAARYAWLDAARRRLGADLVFTAHHADDQVETVLMRVLRGSGPAGLAGMAPCRGALVRPLLPFRRADLAQHLAEAGLSAWIDPANADPRHLRSWLRTEILPLLREKLADVDSHLHRLAAQAARDRAAWDALLDRLPELAFRQENDGVSVAAPPLNGYDSALAQALLIAAARRAGCQLGPARLSRVMELARSGASGASVPLGGDWRADLSFGRLHIGRVRSETPDAPWPLEGDTGEGRWGRWRIRWHRAVAPDRQERGGLTAWFRHAPLAAAPLTVRGWSPGDRVRPLAGAGHRPVAHCFQEARVPRRRRGGWPVFVQEDHVVWVPGVCRSDALMPDAGTEALRVDAEYA